MEKTMKSIQIISTPKHTLAHTIKLKMETIYQSDYSLPFGRELFDDPQSSSSFQSDKRLPLLLAVVLAGSSSHPSSFVFLFDQPLEYEVEQIEIRQIYGEKFSFRWIERRKTISNSEISGIFTAYEIKIKYLIFTCSLNMHSFCRESHC